MLLQVILVAAMLLLLKFFVPHSPPPFEIEDPALVEVPAEITAPALTKRTESSHIIDQQ